MLTTDDLHLNDQGERRFQTVGVGRMGVDPPAKPVGDGREDNPAGQTSIKPNHASERKNHHPELRGKN